MTMGCQTSAIVKKAKQFSPVYKEGNSSPLSVELLIGLLPIHEMLDTNAVLTPPLVRGDGGSMCSALKVKWYYAKPNDCRV